MLKNYKTNKKNDSYFAGYLRSASQFLKNQGVVLTLSLLFFGSIMQAQDITPPVIICPADITVDSDPGMCGANVDFEFTATDDSGEVTITSLVSSGDFFDAGLEVGYLLTATDPSGNATTCSFTIQVNDTELPEITCPADITLTAPLGSTSVPNIGLEEATGSDNCGVFMDSIFIIPFSGDTLFLPNSITSDAPSDFPLGQTTVTWSFLDNAGNETTCTQTVTVEFDTTPPVIICPPEIIVDTEPGLCGAHVDFEVIVTDNSNAPVTTSSIFESGDFFDANSLAIGFGVIATDQSGNTAQCNVIIRVNDIEPPVITCPADITLLAPGGSASIPNPGLVEATASDNCGLILNPNPFFPSDLTNDAPSDFPIGQTTVTWSVTDNLGEGLTSTCTQIVTVLDSGDSTPPVAVCQDITINMSDAPGGEVIITADDIDNGSTDDNGNVSLAISQSSFGCDDPSVNSVVLTVTDDAGNSNTCTANVTVQDITPPVVGCQDITVELDDNGVANISSSDINISFFDNCSASIALSQNTFDCSHIGDNLVTITATDFSAGNVGTCESIVTIVDNTPPVAACQGAITISLSDASPGVVTITPEDIDNNSFDNCGNVNLSISKSSFSCEDRGGNFVVLTVTDDAGNSSTCSTVVVVEDVTPPAVVCQDITVELDEINGNLITVLDIIEPISDNCTLTNISVSPTSFSCANIGDNIVTISANDNSGNNTTCESTVTIVDTEAPVLTCPADITVAIPFGTTEATNVTLGTPSATDNCFPGAITDNAPSVFVLGQTTVTWTVADISGNETTCTQIVTIEEDIDREQPMLTCPGLIAVSNDPGMCGAIVNFVIEASDNSGEVVVTTAAVSGAFYDAGIPSTFLVTATDPAGNFTICNLTILVLDNELPEITCPADITLTVPMGSTTAPNVGLEEATATDNCGIINGILSNAPSEFPLGQTIVTWTASAIGTAPSTCTQTVTVEEVDSTPPVAVCQDITISLSDIQGGLTEITATDIDNGSTDNSGNVSFTISKSSFTCGDLGDNVVELTVTDDAGNNSTCTATVTVEDLTAPTVLCKNITLELDGSGNASVSSSDIMEELNDNCGASVSVSPFNLDCSNIGDNVVTLTATDLSGNIGTCESIVTIVDAEAPVLTCPVDITITVPLGTGGATNVTLATPSATDNCPLNPFTNDAPSTFTVGQTIVTWSVTDNSGNETTCSQLVTVEEIDITPPVLTCPEVGALEVLSDADMCGTNVDFMVTATDDSGLPITIVYEDIFNGGEVFNGDFFDVTSYLIQATATDQAGNTSICTFSLLVDDVEAPVLTCPNDITITVPFGTSEATNVVLGMATATDNCPLDTSLNPITNDAPNVFPIGQTTVSWSIMDGFGGSTVSVGTCTQTVTVIQEMPMGTPEITCPADLFLDFNGNGGNDVAIQDWINAASALDAFGASEGITTDFDANSFSECVDFGTQTVTFTSASGETCTATVTVSYTEPTCSVEDFESLSTGDIVSNQLPGVTVSATSTDNAGAGNLAMIFDSANPTGGDNDLFSAVHGLVLIISEDLDSSDPDDEAHGGVITFDFDTPQYVGEMGFLDIENSYSKVSLFDVSGNLIQTLDIPDTGNGGSGSLIINTENVSSIEVDLMTSGAVTDLCSYDQSLIPDCLVVECMTTPTCQTEDFEAFQRGDIIGSQIPGITVYGSSNNFPGTNAAMIFDSQNPTGGDYDLSTASEGMILILTEDGDSNDPDDAVNGGTLEFVFDTPQFVDHITLLDIQTNNATVKLFSSTGTLIQSFTVPNGGNGNLVDLPLGVDDVASMEVYFPNSGAVVDFCKYESGSLVACPSLTCGVPVLYSDFEGSANGGYGVWTDGGSDATHHNFNSSLVIDKYAVRIRDNSGSSKITSQEYDLSTFDNLTLDFSYITRSVEYGENFFFEISLDGGSSFTSVQSWTKGVDFNNQVRYFETVEIAGPFSNEVKFRFRNNMSVNNDRVYLDNISIVGCSTSSSPALRIDKPQEENLATEELLLDQPEGERSLTLKVFPNPVEGSLNVYGIDSNQDFEIISINGVVLMKGYSEGRINVSHLDSGTYIIRTSDGRVTRFMKINY